jgi:hypothetical protein
MEEKIGFRAAILLVSCIFLTGCAAVAPLSSAIGGGGAPASNLEVRSSTEVRLQQGNFVVIRTNVVGASKGFKLLGFITFHPATLNTAMNRLYAQAQAQHGRPQTLTHLIVERSGIYVILFSIPRVTVRADLIEFLPPMQLLPNERDNSDFRTQEAAERPAPALAQPLL